jgi:translation initiation factor IF-2
VLGLQGVPQAGDTFQVVSDVERAQDIAQQRQMHARQAAMLKTTKRGIESLGQAEIKELLRHSQGRRSRFGRGAPRDAREAFDREGQGSCYPCRRRCDRRVRRPARFRDTGRHFNGSRHHRLQRRPEARVADIAKHEDVDIRLHSIIYKVEEEITAAMIGMLDAIEKEVILGKAARSGDIQGFAYWHHRRLSRGTDGCHPPPGERRG